MLRALQKRGDDMTALKAIRAKCLDCCGGQVNEVKLCPITNCSLYSFRFGKNPNMSGRKLSDKQKEALKRNSFVKKTQ